MKNLRSLVLVQLLVVFWFMVIVAESGDVTKRDVHRIILKSGRTTRSQRGRGKGPPHHHNLKRNPHHHRGSFEDSLENSYEDSSTPIKHNKYNHHRYHHKKPKPRPNKKYEESHNKKLHSFENSEWTPIVSSEVSHSFNDNEKDNRAKDSSRHRHALQIEFTTNHPQPYPPLFEANTFIQPFDNSHFNQKALNFREPFVLKSPLLIRNGNGDEFRNYEVREDPADGDAARSEQNAFEVLVPALDLTKAQQSVKEEVESKKKEKEEEREEDEDEKLRRNKNKRRRPLRRKPTNQ